MSPLALAEPAPPPPENAREIGFKQVSPGKAPHARVVGLEHDALRSMTAGRYTAFVVFTEAERFHTVLVVNA